MKPVKNPPSIARAPRAEILFSAPDGGAEDKKNAVRGQMLASTNFYHSGRLAAADSKAASLMAIAGVGIGFLVQRAPMQAESTLEAALLLARHPSLALLMLTILVAALAQRAVRIAGPDWVSHLVAGQDARDVAREFMGQSARELLTMWVVSQSNLARIAQRKYALVNAATALMCVGFASAVFGL